MEDSMGSREDILQSMEGTHRKGILQRTAMHLRATLPLAILQLGILRHMAATALVRIVDMADLV